MNTVQPLPAATTPAWWRRLVAGAVGVIVASVLSMTGQALYWGTARPVSSAHEVSEVIGAATGHAPDPARVDRAEHTFDVGTPARMIDPPWTTALLGGSEFDLAATDVPESALAAPPGEIVTALGGHGWTLRAEPAGPVAERDGLVAGVDAGRSDAQEVVRFHRSAGGSWMLLALILPLIAGAAAGVAARDLPMKRPGGILVAGAVGAGLLVLAALLQLAETLWGATLPPAERGRYFFSGINDVFVLSLIPKVGLLLLVVAATQPVRTTLTRSSMRLA